MAVMFRSVLANLFTNVCTLVALHSWSLQMNDGLASTDSSRICNENGSMVAMHPPFFTGNKLTRMVDQLEVTGDAVSLIIPEALC